MKHIPPPVPDELLQQIKLNEEMLSKYQIPIDMMPKHSNNAGFGLEQIRKAILEALAEAWLERKARI